MQNNVVLGVGDFGASATTGETIKTLALGSCIAVIILDPKSRCVGMVHVALPDSKISPEKVKTRPGYFADTGIPTLLDAMKKAGSNAKNGREFVVKLAGGANVMDSNNTFNIGKRNALAIKKILWQYGMGSVAEDIGGKMSRSVRVGVDTGRVVISSPGMDDWEI